MRKVIFLFAILVSLTSTANSQSPLQCDRLERVFDRLHCIETIFERFPEHFTPVKTGVWASETYKWILNITPASRRSSDELYIKFGNLILQGAQDDPPGHLLISFICREQRKLFWLSITGHTPVASVGMSMVTFRFADGTKFKRQWELFDGDSLKTTDLAAERQLLQKFSNGEKVEVELQTQEAGTVTASLDLTSLDVGLRPVRYVCGW